MNALRTQCLAGCGRHGRRRLCLRGGHGVSSCEQARRRRIRREPQHSRTALLHRRHPPLRVAAATAGRPLRQMTQLGSPQPSRRRSRGSAAAAATGGARCSSPVGSMSARRSSRRPSAWSRRPATSAATRAPRPSSRTCCPPLRRKPSPLPACRSPLLRLSRSLQRLSAGRHF